MIDFTSARIDSIVFHRVGNKIKGEPLRLSSDIYKLSADVEDVLLNHFLKPFRSLTLQKFTHLSSVSLNPIYTYSVERFEQRRTLVQISVDVAKYLYSKSIHPQILGGALSVVQLAGILLNGTPVDVIGLFKAERKDTFIKLMDNGDAIQIFIENGTHSEKLDKGCLIFNHMKEDGLRLLAVDHLGKASQYWARDFLNISTLPSDETRTLEYIAFCTNFAASLPDQKKAVAFVEDTFDLLSQGLYDEDGFKQHVLDKHSIDRTFFDERRNDYEKQNNLSLTEFTTVSQTALRKAKRQRLRTIKLDNENALLVTRMLDSQGLELIEKGYDENRKMHYYKLFFTKEAN